MQQAMTHQQHLESKCRFCIQTIKIGSKKKSLTNVWLKEYFSQFWENMLMVQKEDNLNFSKFSCMACYQKMYRHYKAYDKHKGKEIKLPMNRRKPFEYPFKQIDFQTDQEFTHSVNCKICGIAELVEPQVVEPHMQASPGVYKRKEISPVSTPRAKRADSRKQGTARRTLLLDKIEPMNLDQDNPDIEPVTISKVGTRIASDSEVVLKEHIKDQSVAKAFYCNICER